MTFPALSRLAASVTALTALFGTDSVAQVKVGDKAPAIEAKQLLNTRMRSLAETRGKVVLYDFFAYW